MADLYTRQLAQRNAYLRELQMRNQDVIRQQALGQVQQRAAQQAEQWGATHQRNLTKDQWEAQMRVAEFRQRQMEAAQRARERQDAISRQETRDLEARRGRLSPDHRWSASDPLKQELIPNSKTWGDLQTKHAKDVSQLRSIDSSTNELLGVINYILDPKNKSGFESNFGGYNAYLTRLLPNIIPGFARTSDVSSALERLQEMAEVSGLGAVRGNSGQSVGAITEREWPKFASQILKTSPRMEEDTARMWLNQVKQTAADIRNREVEEYTNAWKGKPFYVENPLAGRIAPATVNPAVPQGIDAKDWEYMTPEQRALWR